MSALCITSNWVASMIFKDAIALLFFVWAGNLALHIIYLYLLKPCFSIVICFFFNMLLLTFLLSYFQKSSLTLKKELSGSAEPNTHACCLRLSPDSWSISRIRYWTHDYWKHLSPPIVLEWFRLSFFFQLRYVLCVRVKGRGSLVL